MVFAGLVSLALFAGPIMAAPATRATLLDIQRFDGETSGKYIVKLKDSTTSRSSVMGDFSAFSSSARANITHEWKPKFFNGFAGEFDQDALDALRANPNVESIVEDGIMQAFSTVNQTDAPWGLSRVSQPGAVEGEATSLNYTYGYDDAAGEGVNVYVVDTGIRVTHEEFEGRASWGATFGKYEDADGNGHGTHCAGTVGSARYGVAKKANLIAVKVLGDDTFGTSSNIVSGLQWVADEAEASGQPTVVLMSLGGGASPTLDSAVSKLVAAGIHVVVAAGNFGADAKYTSPARVPEVVTVGSTDINDVIAIDSNYGAVVDLFAPGVDIISTWISNDTATNSISGTSMAAPHVAGIVASLISRNGDSSPEDMSAALKDLAVADAISGLRTGTANLLAQNGLY